MIGIERGSLPAAASPGAPPQELPQDERQDQRARGKPDVECQEGFGSPIKRVGRQRVGRSGRTNRGERSE